MTIEIDALGIDYQIDRAFGILHSLSMKSYFEAFEEAEKFDDEDLNALLECAPNPLLYVMERELFVLVAWTLVNTADFEKGRFALPSMNAIRGCGRKPGPTRLRRFPNVRSG